MIGAATGADERTWPETVRPVSEAPGRRLHLGFASAVAMWRTRDIDAVKKGIVLARLLLLSAAAPWATAATGLTSRNQADHLEFLNLPSPEASAVLRPVRSQMCQKPGRPGDRLKDPVSVMRIRGGGIRAGGADSLISGDRDSDPGAYGAGSRPRTVSQTIEPDLVIVVAGDPQPFKAVCIVVDRQGAKKQIAFEGQAPVSLPLDGAAADCRVDRVDQHAGRLSVELYARTSSLPLAANSTDEAFGCVHVRSDGPWGRADGRRCSRIIRRLR